MQILLIAAILVAEPPANTSFRTEVAPRVDPVFADVAGLRHTLDRFMTLDREMQQAADQFSNAVHDTLAELARTAGDSRQTSEARNATTELVCPLAIASDYERARDAGIRYLGLGRQLDKEMRTIRAAEAYGDTVALTPDYRHKAEQARHDHAELLRGLREMQVAFHDQLESEMRYAGCPVQSLPPAAPDKTPDGAPAAEPAPAPPPPPVQAAPAAEDARIVIDSSRCAQQSRLSVDGKLLGSVEGHRRTLVRVPQGPHAFCILPTLGAGTCGDPGTVRQAYAHDGWVLEVRCEK